MINLIKNELYKIFHKKGIYIVTIITALYVLLTNVIYTTTIEYDYIDDSYESEMIYLEMLEESEDSDIEEIISSKTLINMYEYANSFGKDSWQRKIVIRDYNLYERIYGLNEIIVRYENKLDKDKILYEDAKKELQNIKNELSNKKEIEYIKEQIVVCKEDLKLDNSYSNKAELEALELRYKYKISFTNDSLNDYLDTYKYNREYIMELDEKSVLSEEDEKYYIQLKQETEVSKAYIENLIDAEKADGQYQIYNYFYNEYFIMILVFIILISGSIVSEEFSKGTIKLLLVKPYTRIKILLSKYISSLIMILFAIIVPILMQLIIGSIIYGIDSLSTPAIVYNYITQTAETISLFKYLLLQTLGILPELILISTIAFTFSTLFISTSLANTLTIIGVFGSNLIGLYAQSFEIEILKYFVTLNWDWTVYLFGGTSPYIGVTFPFSVAICIIYLVILIALSLIVFNKRNIKNV